MNSQGFSIKSNGIFGILFFILLLVGLFFIARFIFNILYIASPVLIVLSLIINYRTILNYFKFILSLLQRNPLAGIVGILLSVIGFPVLSFVLFGKAIIDRKVRKLHSAHEASVASEYVEYEEVIKPERKDTLDLPPIEKHEAEKKDNRYDKLF